MVDENFFYFYLKLWIEKQTPILTSHHIGGQNLESQLLELTFQAIGLTSLLFIGYYRRLTQQNRKISPNDGEIQWEKNYLKFIRILMSFFYVIAFFYGFLPLISLIIPSIPYLEILEVEIPLALRLLGVLGVIVSTIFLVWTTKTLGTNFSPKLELRQNHQLVTDGPYRWIRHPMYMGNAFWIVAFTLMSSWWVFIIYLVLFVTFIMIIRTPLEEQMMLERFGEQYRRYMDKTGRFVPKIKL